MSGFVASSDAEARRTLPPTACSRRLPARRRGSALLTLVASARPAADYRRAGHGPAAAGEVRRIGRTLERDDEVTRRERSRAAIAPLASVGAIARLSAHVRGAPRHGAKREARPELVAEHIGERCWPEHAGRPRVGYVGSGARDPAQPIGADRATE